VEIPSASYLESASTVQISNFFLTLLLFSILFCVFLFFPRRSMRPPLNLTPPSVFRSDPLLLMPGPLHPLDLFVFSHDLQQVKRPNVLLGFRDQRRARLSEENPCPPPPPKFFFFSISIGGVSPFFFHYHTLALTLEHLRTSFPPLPIVAGFFPRAIDAGRLLLRGFPSLESSPTSSATDSPCSLLFTLAFFLLRPWALPPHRGSYYERETDCVSELKGNP